MSFEHISADDRRRPIPLLLTAVGILVIAVTLAQQLASDDHRLAAVTALVATAAWALHAVLPRRSPAVVRGAALLVMVVAGGFSSPHTDVIGIVPAAIGILVAVGSLAWPLGYGIGAVLLGVASAGACAIAFPAPDGALLGTFVGLLAAILISISRRQYRAAELRSRELLEERVILEQERARSAALAERSRIARDIHDVLAHSLGGLVLQLDAVEAELEAGRTPEALSRVRAAHGLAAEGLSEARRAVTALRDPAQADLAAAIRALVSTHVSLGASAEFTEEGTAWGVSPETTDAVTRAAQELLSNARRHAPGARTMLALDWGESLELSVSTPRVGAVVVASPGGGHGLTGLRERAAALGGTATVSDGDPFVVTVRVPR